MTAPAGMSPGDALVALDAVLVALDGDTDRAYVMAAERFGPEGLVAALLVALRIFGDDAYGGRAGLVARLRALTLAIQVEQVGAEAAPGTES